MKHQVENSRSTHYRGTLYKGTCFSAHFHNSYELICVLSGGVSVTVNGQTSELCEREFFLISPCAAHSISSTDDAVFFISIISPDYITDFYESHKGDVAYRFFVDDDAFEYIKAHLVEKEGQTRYELKSCLYMALSFVDSGERVRMSEDNNYSFIYAVNRYIADNFAEPIKRAHLAALTGYEEHYFSEVFKKNFGMGFVRYVNTYRIAHAARLLGSTDDKICQIALDCGFSSVKEFNNVFLILMSETPSQYRKRRKAQ